MLLEAAMPVRNCAKHGKKFTNRFNHQDMATLHSPLPATAPFFCAVFISILNCVLIEQSSANQGCAHTHVHSVDLPLSLGLYN